MLNITSNSSNYINFSFKLGKLTFAERLIFWTIVLTPLWWMLGIQTLLYPAVAAFLLAYGFKFDNIIQGSLPFSNWTRIRMILVDL